MSDVVSFFVHNLGGNPLGRAIPIAKALERRGYNVEVLGFIFGKRDVYAPYRQEINAKIIRTTKKPVEFFRKAQKLARQAEGDIIYAFKPLMTTLAPALFAARIVKSRPLLLDVEDEEVYLNTVTSFQDVWMKILRGWRLATSWKYTRLLQLFRGSVDATTVVSTTLKERYGGTILRHGPDEHQFYPDRFGQPHQLREKWGLPTDRKLAFFIGTPKSHKGLPVLAEAVALPKCRNWDLVLVGPTDNPFAQAAKNRLEDRVHSLGMQSYHLAPELLSMADAIPIPQLPTSFAEAQVPAKLLDAMAMARPIVASRIGDLPDILGDGERGWLIEPGSSESLANALSEIDENPRAASTRAQRARNWYVENASTTAIKEKLESILECLSR